MKPFSLPIRFLLLLACLPHLAVMAENLERARLYSTPDAESTGGIRGEISAPSLPIRQILAIPPDEPRLVYRGTVSGNSQQTFRFDGLPMRNYDLVVIYDNQFFEGLQLHRTPSTLSPQDVEKIDETIQKAEPFFQVKQVHRLEGTTGRGNTARGIYTFLRTSKSSDPTNNTGKTQRRTFKLVMLKDVGPGWQITRARDLYPIYVDPEYNDPSHHFTPRLSKIRVTDYLKDLGTINLLQ